LLSAVRLCRPPPGFDLCADRPPPASLYQTYFQKLNSFTITQLNEFIRVLNTQMGLSIRTTQAKKADIVLRCVLFPRTCQSLPTSSEARASVACGGDRAAVSDLARSRWPGRRP
jgi:hypothetical protein